MDLRFRDPISYQAPTDQVDSSAIYPIGTIAKAYDIDPTSSYGEVELIYMTAGTGVTEIAGSVVSFGGKYLSALAVADAKGGIAVSLAAKTEGQSGWYVVRGNVPASVLASFAANAKCFLTATAGSLDDAAVVGDDVFFAFSVTAIGTPSTGLAVIYLNNSFTMNGLAA
jgi:hypothetical protein